MTRNQEPRRHGWLPFASLIFALLAFVTPFNVIFGALAIASGAAGLACHFRHAAWVVRNAPVD